MTVGEVLKGDFSVFHLANAESEIQSAYVGDFLSWVIGKVGDAAIWFTVMNNQNVAAVACLAECVAIVLCEGVEPDAQLLDRCKRENLNLLGSKRSAYDTCVAFHAISGI